jgi:hypothetical protein
MGQSYGFEQGAVERISTALKLWKLFFKVSDFKLSLFFETLKLIFY